MGNDISKRNDENSFTRAVDNAIRSATPSTLGDSPVRSYSSLIDSAIRSSTASSTDADFDLLFHTLGLPGPDDDDFEITPPPSEQAQTQQHRVASPPPPNTVNLQTTKRRSSRPNPRLSNPPNHVHGEQVAAGWPSWLSMVAGEAINGWIPRRADTYERIYKIGQGTYSNVYKARDTITGKIVALKKVRFDNLEPESVKFMAREILILHRLDHPNIVKLEGLATSRMSCSLFLVFEYMVHDLAGLATNQAIKFTESQVKCYMHQLFSALEHCHNRGVLHRDIKGSDLLIDNDGVLKIADFGLASFFDPNHKHPMTSRGVSLWYRPPEQLLGATEYSVGVDLWSSGCILAELLAGKPIMPGRTEVEQLSKIYELCGSPSDEYWKKSKLPLATMFKPQQSYKRCIAETFKDFPPSSLPLIETLLAIDPDERLTATAALHSEHPMTSRVVTLWYRPPELLLGATEYSVGVDLWSAGCILAELLAGKPIMPGRTEVEQLHKIFKLCGSPSDEYWKKSKLPHATIFKPQQSYKRSIAETFKDFPPSSLPLIETLLAIDPDERLTATAALHSEFFTTEPYACDPSSLPKYPPSKEMDAKLRDEEARRLRAAGKANADGVKKSRPRDRAGRGIPVPEANAELQANIDRRRLITHANAKSKSEKFPPPHQDGALGYPLGSSHHMDPAFDPPDVPFSSTNFSQPKANIQTWSGPLADPAAVGAPRRKKKHGK